MVAAANLFDPDGARSALVRKWHQLGFYGHQNLAGVMAAGAAAHASGKMTFFSEVGTVSATLEDLHKKSRHLAGALYAAGLRRGDTIAIQVPNWIEGALIYQASMILGAIILPIIHIYGPKEVSYVLNKSKARALVVPDRWRNIDYLERLDSLETTPHLRHIFVIGQNAPEGTVSWSSLTEKATDSFPESDADADEVSLLLFTSGTTADPKGVLHTHNTLLSEVRASEGDMGGGKSVSLSPWPSGHIAGVLGILRLYILGVSSILMDIWDAEAAVRLIESYKVTSTSGTPFFLMSLLDAAEATGGDVSSISRYLTGAANVPPALVQRCEKFGVPTFRAYGSSEHPTISSGEPNDPIDKRSFTDGKITAGNQVRIVDEEGRSVPPMSEGEIVAIGPEQFIGYLDNTVNEASFFPGGWFRTGDIGRLDEEGYLTITDRKKDIIIRGGENISSKEVEDILSRHTAVREGAVTAVPDARLGEKVCAFVILKNGQSLTLDDVNEHFVQEGVARQKTPEHLVILDKLPRTAAGKVKKFELRASLKLQQI